VVQLEHPGLALRLIDLAAAFCRDARSTRDTDLDALVETLAAPDGDDHVALAEASRKTARLARLSLPAPAAGAHAFVPEASYLLTGGAGGIGRAVLEALVARGARRVVLMGRSVPRGDAKELLDALGTRGVDVRFVTGDAAKNDDVARAL